MDALRDRWRGLCGRVGRTPRLADALFDRVRDLYATPPRAYHNLEHVVACLAVLDDVRGAAEQPDLVEFALWLHDAVCEPGAPDNEERSAARAEQFLAALNATAHAATVHGLILATRHAAAPAKPDERLIADIDLAVLASPPAVYDAYAAAIRTEYAAVPEMEFRAGRRCFLQALRARPQLYHTAILHARCEAPARQNLLRELQQHPP